MNPKYVFTLGRQVESVQFTVDHVVLNSSSLSAKNVEPGDLIEVKFDDVSVLAIMFGQKHKKDNGNWWFQAIRVNAG